MKVKTSELSGVALDWAVAKSEHGDNVYIHKRDFLKMTYKNGHPIPAINDPEGDQFAIFMQYSTDWAQGGPIIEREKIQLNTLKNAWEAWRDSDGVFSKGSTPLIAAMRCYVASKLGDVVDIPDDFMKDATK